MGVGCGGAEGCTNIYWTVIVLVFNWRLVVFDRCYRTDQLINTNDGSVAKGHDGEVHLHSYNVSKALSACRQNFN